MFDQVEMERLAEHLGLVTDAFLHGEIIPFLGAGATLCDRPPNATWESGKYLPSGSELAEMLSENLIVDNKNDLLRVSQYFSIKLGERTLYNRLHKVFNQPDLAVTTLHNFLASLPGWLRSKGISPGHLLVMTTNYDNMLERAFEKAGEPFDVVSYEAKERLVNTFGKFWHQPHHGEKRIIDKPNEYSEVSLENASVILKIHGAFDPNNEDSDSYVITEDNYIDYLARTEVANLFPINLREKIYNSHFLFLGYSLADWNMRAILRQIEAHQLLTSTSWAIQKSPSRVDQEIWGKRKPPVEIFNMDLGHYVAFLRLRLGMV